MMKIKNNMPWMKIIDRLKSPEIDKTTLFKTLHEAIGKNAKLKELELPSMTAVVALKSIAAEKKAQIYTQNVKKALSRISKIANKEKRKDMLDMLNKMAPQPYDYAVIAMNTYLKMDKTHTIDSFYKEYNIYSQRQEEKDNTKLNMVTKNIVRDM